MPRLRPIQMNLSNGEISPFLYGRSDLDKYWSSVETAENVIILPYGGMMRRPGFQYVAAQGDEDRKCRLIPFTFNTEQAYILEFGHEYIRFHMNHGPILETDTHDVLLLHFDGKNDSQTFVDSGTTGHTVTANNNARQSTLQRKFGPASGYFKSSTSDYLTISDHADFDFSNDICTIECWFMTLSQSGTFPLYYHGTDANNFFSLYLSGRSAYMYLINSGTDVQTLDPGSGPFFEPNEWHHFRFVADGSDYYIFIDGIEIASDPILYSAQNYTGDIYIGRQLTNYANGYIDEFRVNDTAVGITAFNPPTSQYPIGTDAVEVESPYEENDLQLIKYIGLFDTLYLFHPDYAWRKLTRSSNTSWTLSTITPTNWPYGNEVTSPNISTNGTTGTVTMTTSSAFFYANQVGVKIKLQDANDNSWGLATIATVASTTSATATVVETLGSSQVYDVHRWQAFNPFYGYPSCGSLVEESMVLAATDQQPRTVFASTKGDYEDFEEGTEDDDAYIYTIPATNRIVWMSEIEDLAIATGDGVYRMTGGADDYISPTNVRVKHQLSIGAKDMMPIKVSDTILFWQKGGRKLRELVYDPASVDAKLVAPDLTLLAEHVTDGGIVYHDWAQENYGMLWAVRSDGVMPTMTYLRKENVVGWARQITDGIVESVAVIPDPTDTYNEVWISVLREEGDGTQRRYIEFANPDIYCDSAFIYDGGDPGTASQTISGLDHLEGNTVDIVGDGVVYAQQTVSGGEVTLTPPASYAVIGLPYTHKIVTVRPTIQMGPGTTAGTRFKWAEAYALVKDTSSLTINDEIIDFRVLGDVDVGEEIPLYSGYVKISQLGWDQDGQITLESDEPLPCTILSIFGNLETGDD